MTEYKNAVYNIKKSPEGKMVDKNVKVEIDGVVSFVPMLQDNEDYQEILKQVKEGTLTIKDAD
tara:strand:+ start:1050 stop:1238 length:189 start_codon:yes stop_codon:yes gene_type:complete